MRKFVTLSAVAFLSTMAFADADTQKQIDELKKKIEQLEKANKAQDTRISKVNAQSAMDNIKFDVDFRTSYDNLRYETATGKHYSNSSLYSNRLWLGMGYAPTESMMFKGQLAVNKAFGANYDQRGGGFDTFDWILNETLTDDTIKLREAYWLWSFDTGKIGWTVSAGRRPATNGYLINLRDDDEAKSPMGHIINMEFDGASAAMKLDKYISGMYFKLCLGRGLTNASAWATEANDYLAGNGGATTPNYINENDKLDNVDMVGLIFQPYDNGQYSVMTKFYRGFSVPGLSRNPSDPTEASLESFGDMDGAAISFKTDGIGDGINDFLDDTIVFASFAASKTRPNEDQAMLGSLDDETGTSFWLGTQMPNLTGGKFGLEYNHGSKFWRPFTYGEDTMIGSKMAVRGNAYEAYWTQPLIKDVFSMQIRYTYLDYEYTGSNAFFGDGGTPLTMSEAVNNYGMDPVETAQDLRVYFRYRY